MAAGNLNVSRKWVFINYGKSELRALLKNEEKNCLKLIELIRWIANENCPQQHKKSNYLREWFTSNDSLLRWWYRWYQSSHTLGLIQPKRKCVWCAVVKYSPKDGSTLWHLPRGDIRPSYIGVMLIRFRPLFAYESLH